jgi:hypothetical protein
LSLGVPIAPPPVEPRKTDFRYVAGVKYEKGKWSGQLQYQQGNKAVLDHSLVGEISSGKSQSINLQLLYRLK